jgi:mono/diheme cytochrome c family protein
MRRTSILAAAAALLLSACSKEPARPVPPDGAALFREQNCIQCHGDDGSGTNLGPTLHGKKQFWTREKIAVYLADPQAVIQGDARLTAQKEKYMLPMVKFPYLTLEQRLALADHVLALP